MRHKNNSEGLINHTKTKATKKMSAEKPKSDKELVQKQLTCGDRIVTGKELNKVYPIIYDKIISYKKSFEKNGFFLDYFISTDREFKSYEEIEEYAKTYFEQLFGKDVIGADDYSVEKVWKDNLGKYHMFVHFNSSLFNFNIVSTIAECSPIMPCYLKIYHVPFPCLFIYCDKLNISEVVPLSTFDMKMKKDSSGNRFIRVAIRESDHRKNRKTPTLLFYSDSFVRNMFHGEDGQHPHLLGGSRFSKTSVSTFVRSFREFMALEKAHTCGKLTVKVLFSRKSGKKTK